MPQAIEVVDIESYQDKFENKLLDFAHKYQMKHRFELGEEIPVGEMKHTLVFSNLLCNLNCEMIDYIWDKIDGKLDNKKISDCVKQPTVENQGCFVCWNKIQW